MSRCSGRLEVALELIIDPPHAVGPIAIGMSFDDAVQVLRSIDGYVVSEPTPRQSPGFAHYDSGLSIELGPDGSGRVKAIEVYRPGPEVDVLYRDIPLFSLPAVEVVRRLAELVRVVEEDDGLSYVAPDLLLSLGRNIIPEDEHDEDGRYFDSVLVAAPGYYDGPFGPAYPDPTGGS